MDARKDDDLVAALEQYEEQQCLVQALNRNSYIPTPKWLAKKRCIVNVINKYDNKCFIWSMLSALYLAALHTEHISHYAKHENSLNVEELQFPMPVN